VKILTKISNFQKLVSKPFLVIAFSVFALPAFSNKVDSLKSVIKQELPDTIRINTLNLLSKESFKSNPSEALEYGKQALALASSLSDELGMAKAYSNVGISYWILGKYPLAMDNLIRALRIFEKLKLQEQISNTYNNIGLVHWQQGNRTEALKYFYKDLALAQIRNNQESIAGSYNNIGLINEELGNNEIALNYFEKSLKIQTLLGNFQGMADNYNNIGGLYKIQGQFGKALDYLQKSLQLRLQFNDQMGIITSNVGLGDIYVKLNQFDKSILFYKKGLEKADSIGFTEGIKNAYLGLSTAYEGKKDLSSALKYFKKFSDVKDSIFTTEAAGQIAEMQVKFNAEKKEQEIKSLLDQAELREQNLNKQKLLKNISFGGVAIVLFLAFLLFRQYRIKEKANNMLEEKNAAIEIQKKEIELKNQKLGVAYKDIQDSINYAKRIQQAILPSTELIYKALQDSFIVYKPKDVVSGDFYAFSERNNKVIIAAVDCTGHGVPGAFMSMIGNEQLNHAIKDKVSPSEILTQLNKGIKVALKQNENSESRDGMDVALVSLEMNPDGEKKKISKLSFSGANRPLYLIRDGQMKEFFPDKSPIGGSIREDQGYTNYDIDVLPGDCFYIFTDGYADQFGGEHGKKLMTKKFKELLLTIHSKPMSEQGKILDSHFEAWKGNHDQVDDVLVIGVKA